MDQHTNMPIDTTHSTSDGRDVAPRLSSGFRVKDYASREYIVPEFLDLSIEQAIAAIKHRGERSVNEVRGSILQHNLTIIYKLATTFLPVCSLLSTVPPLPFLFCRVTAAVWPLPCDCCRVASAAAIWLLPYSRCRKSFSICLPSAIYCEYSTNLSYGSWIV